MSDRTQFPRDFPRAVAAVDQVLAENEDKKRGIWREQSSATHALHLRDHLHEALNGPPDPEYLHLTHAATRAMMMLEQYITEKEKPS